MPLTGDTTPNTMNIKTGDKLWYVPNRGTPCEVTVGKVGRTWFTVREGFLRNSRFRIDNGCQDGGQYSSLGRCYMSREKYEQKQELIRLWQVFTTATQNRFRPPPEIGAVAIRQAAAILGYDLK